MEPYRIDSQQRYHQVPGVIGNNHRTSSSISSDYSESCSSSDTSRSSSWSSVSSREWESHVDQEGELFYVQFCSNLIPDSPKEPAASEDDGPDEFKQKKNKKKKGRLSRLLKKRRSQEGAKAVVQGASKPRSRSQSPVYLPTGVLKQTPTDDWSDWSSFTLELEVHPPSSSALDVGSAGRRTASHQCEALLGFTPGSTQSAEWHGQAPLRQRVIVERLVPGGPLHQGFAHVQPGDWLEKLNGRDVTHRDLNGILSSINSRAIVELNFRRRPPQQHQSPDNRNQDGNVMTRTDSSGELSSSIKSPLPHGILLLSQENVTDSSPETADILYQSQASTGGGGRIDPLLKWRGAAVTLAHLMPQLTSGSTPSGSTVILDGVPVHLAFVAEEHPALFLMAAPSTWCGRIQLQCIAKQLSALFRFQYGSIRRALTDPRWTDEIRRIVDFLFSSLAPGAQAGKPSSVGESSGHPAARLSDFFSSSGQWLPLPPECHLDVTLTLNQMEAMDYEDWDEEAISVQRCVTITGSAVYCQGYLVASTLTGPRLEEIGMFLKWNQILELSHRRRLKELIVWREVFLGDGSDRSFLAVVGSGHTLVAALLQGGGAAQPWDNYPDAFIIDEMQFFLEELQFLDLETVCNQILNSPHNPVLVTNLNSSSDTTIIDMKDPNTQPTFNITPGAKPTLINYISMDFGTGVLIAPTLISAAPKFSEQFQKTSLSIHKLFQQTLKAKVDLQRPDWGGPWSDKSLVALQEVSVCFTVSQESTHNSTTGTKDGSSFWVTGRLFTSPVHRELFVCYQDGVAQDILDLAFHLGFGALL